MVMQRIANPKILEVQILSLTPNILEEGLNPPDNTKTKKKESYTMENLTKEDERYFLNIRKELIDIEDDKIEDEKTVFSTTDDTRSSSTNFMNRTEILEYWTYDNKEIITLGNTKTGWQILRKMDNKNKDNGKLFIGTSTF